MATARTRARTYDEAGIEYKQQTATMALETPLPRVMLARCPFRRVIHPTVARLACWGYAFKSSPPCPGWGGKPGVPGRGGQASCNRFPQAQKTYIAEVPESEDCDWEALSSVMETSVDVDMEEVDQEYSAQGLDCPSNELEEALSGLLQSIPDEDVLRCYTATFPCEEGQRQVQGRSQAQVKSPRRAVDVLGNAIQRVDSRVIGQEKQHARGKGNEA
eukprot:6471110-Amphidinium_carterae.1